MSLPITFFFEFTHQYWIALSSEFIEDKPEDIISLEETMEQYVKDL
jgi:hypothetical protein